MREFDYMIPNQPYWDDWKQTGIVPYAQMDSWNDFNKYLQEKISKIWKPASPAQTKPTVDMEIENTVKQFAL